MDRRIVVICSDLHGGHRYGLLNPETELDEVDEIGQPVGKKNVELTKIQEYLWKMYIQGIQWVKGHAGSDPILVVMNGDLTAGNKHAQMLVSDRMADQIFIGMYNALPWYELNPVAVRLIKGTGAHVFGHGSSEILIGKFLQAARPAIDTRVTDHSLINFGGIDIDISHHGPPTGSREWLKGNEGRYYLRSLMLQEIVAGKIPPRLVVRGHYHEEIEETLIQKSNGNRYKSTLIVVPSFTFPDEYARKVVRSPSRVTHGMTVVEIVNGELLRVTPLTHTQDIRTKEVL